MNTIASYFNVALTSVLHVCLMSVVQKQLIVGHATSYLNVTLTRSCIMCLVLSVVQVTFECRTHMVVHHVSSVVCCPGDI